ncbi:hypothetical protein Bbelb_293070 [Branchiostoma belcheri]|nr:hypothetical protein Bbelb_293070 [Branchiostoma belcheri]
MRMATWNVRTLHQVGKLSNVLREMERCDINVLGVAETHWTGSGFFTATEGEMVIYSGGETHRSGVAVVLSQAASRSMLSYKAVSDRILLVRIMASPFNMYFIQVYAPTADAPDEEVEVFYEQIQQLLQECPSQDIAMVMGDFNAKVGADRLEAEVCGPYGLGTPNERGERLVEFCQDNGLIITGTNTVFKHHARRRYTWILTNSSEAYNIEVCNRFEALNLLQEERTPEEFSESFAEAIKAAAEKVLGKAPRKANHPWISQETLDLIDRRRELKARRTTLSGELLYREVNKRVQSEARKDKARWLEEQCAEMERGLGGNSSLRKSYSIIKKVRRGFQPKQRNIRSEDNRVLTDLQSILQRWKQYCEQLYSDNTSHSDSDDEQDTSSEKSGDESFPEILEAEVEHAIKRLPKNKAAGVDDLPGELLKTDNPAVITALCCLCNRILQTGDWPTDWVRSVFITIPKKPGTTDCSEYRTIALISHTSKILVRILLNRMEKVADQEFAEEQMGFRKKVGTRHQVFNISILMEKARESNVKLFMAFIDYKKALDSVRHRTLWKILKDMGVSRYLVNSLQQLYRRQQAAVRVEDELTDWFQVTKGVRQGCLVSPICFNFYSEAVMRESAGELSWIGVNISGRTVNNLRFADDIALIATLPERLQELLDLVNTVSLQYRLEISTKKTKVMAATKQPTVLRIFCQGVQLEQVSTFMYLGAIIDETAGSSREFSCMAKKVDYLENQSRRNNIIIDGIEGDNNSESWADTEVKVRDIITKNLKLEAKDIEIERAHRNGAFNKNNPRPRPVVKLLRYKDKQLILNKARSHLKNTHMYINEDFSDAVRKKRAELLPELRAARSRGEYAFFSNELSQ